MTISRNYRKVPKCESVGLAIPSTPTLAQLHSKELYFAKILDNKPLEPDRILAIQNEIETLIYYNILFSDIKIKFDVDDTVYSALRRYPSDIEQAYFKMMKKNQ